MTKQELEKAITNHAEWLYEHLLSHPQMFCNPAAIETYIIAVDSLLSAVSESKHGPRTYKAFLGKKKFGARTFESMFALQNRCVLRFAESIETASDKERALNEKYRREIMEHLHEFVEWRRRTDEEVQGNTPS